MVEDGLKGLGLLCQFHLYDILGKTKTTEIGRSVGVRSHCGGMIVQGYTRGFFYVMEMPYGTVAVIVWLYTGVKANTTMYRPQSNL